MNERTEPVVQVEANPPTIRLSAAQIDELARPLLRIVKKFYEDPENEKKFQEWLREREDRT